MENAKRTFANYNKCRNFLCNKLNEGADIYQALRISKVGGNPDTRKFLENLGFVAGGTVTIVSEIGRNVIVNVKDSRVAVSKEMACKIMV